MFHSQMLMWELFLVKLRREGEISFYTKEENHPRGLLETKKKKVDKIFFC